jgi:hypothetical protein
MKRAIKLVERVGTDCSSLAGWVLSGGEPLNSPNFTAVLGRLKRWRRVYANTILPADKLPLVEDLLSNGLLSGMSISRHARSEQEEQFLGVASDEQIAQLIAKFPKKSIRINCVVDDARPRGYYGGVLDRWRGKAPWVVFRQDFRDTTRNDLGALDRVPSNLLKHKMSKSGRCAVCFGVDFKVPGFKTVSYHQGTESTLIERAAAEISVVHDIVISPNGNVSFDWFGADHREGVEQLAAASADAELFYSRDNSCSGIRRKRSLGLYDLQRLQYPVVYRDLRDGKEL